MKKMRKVLWTVLIVWGTSSPALAAKNLILMISDGQGFNTMQATDYYTGSQAVYEGPDFLRLAMQTNSANNPDGYNPMAMASDFNYAKSGATDSASAATAMYTGQKNYDGQLNWSTTGQPLTTLFEIAAQRGSSIGAVTSVQISHATPAAVYAHNSSRNNYAAIANEGIYGDYNGNFKVLMGAGHPEFSNNGTPAANDPRYVGGSTTWADIQDADGANGFTYITDKSDFEALANGTLTADKVLGIAQAQTTLQQSRTNSWNNSVPTLATMSTAALNVLGTNPEGFAVMIEGGAVDWANHANQLDRMIEEQMDFNNSVRAVVDWVNTYSSWDETLLIVTADHECGHLWGDGTSGFFDVDGDGLFTAGVDYGHIADNGAGVLPGARYFSGSHTNALVPLFAKGAGAELFADYVIGYDSNLSSLYNLDSDVWDGAYVDNTAVYSVAMTVIPEPATLVLLGLGSLLFANRRR